MLKTVFSEKYKKDISYYTEDIERLSGEPVCMGYADDGDEVYEITFEKRSRMDVITGSGNRNNFVFQL